MRTRSVAGSRRLDANRTSHREPGRECPRCDARRWASTIRTRNVDVTQSNAGTHSEMAAGSYVQLTVADSGRGMDEDTGFGRSILSSPPNRSVRAPGSSFDRLRRHLAERRFHPSRQRTRTGHTVRIYLPRAFGTATAAPAASTEPVEGARRPCCSSKTRRGCASC